MGEGEEIHSTDELLLVTALRPQKCPGSVVHFNLSNVSSVAQLESNVESIGESNCGDCYSAGSPRKHTNSKIITRNTSIRKVAKPKNFSVWRNVNASEDPHIEDLQQL